MKIAFIFTDKPDITQVPSEERYKSDFELPDAAKSLPDIEAHVIAIGELVAQFTNSSLHISCPDIGLKNYTIKQVDEPTKITEKLLYNRNAMCLYFEPDGHKYWLKRTLKIYSPQTPQLPRRFSGDKGYYYNLTDKWEDPSLNSFIERVRALSEQLLALLNTDEGNWRFERFHPYLWQNGLATRSKKYFRNVHSEQRKQTREDEKRKAREAKLAAKAAAAPPTTLTHGAGRTVGARPGIYKGIQMRSQLEIRFAAELDERGIRWIYEGETLSAAGYLVDFFLPDLGAWVEVKGKFEARDRQVLPEVARYLKAERQHRLLVYTGSGQCCVVNPSGFREIERKNFWAELMR